MGILKIWEVYPGLASAVNYEHQKVGLTNGGHDMDHALRVAQMAYVVTMDENPEMALLAGVAGLLHNNDRILERSLKIDFSKNVSEAPVEVVIEMTSRMLDEWTGISGVDQKKWIIDAVVNHGSKPNHPDDHLVTIALADADRLINMEPDVIIRIGQHHPDIPALDPIYIEATPGANYCDPKTVMWDIANCITWAAETGSYILRLPKARELGQERAAYLRTFIDTLKRQRAELGLVLYPVF